MTTDLTFNQMSEEEFAALSSSEKTRLAGAWHQGIIHSSREAISQVVSTGLDEIDKWNEHAEAEGKPMKHPNSLLVLIAHVDDPVLPEDLRKKWDDQNLEYGVLSVDRHVWTGGPGAKAWERKHPYKKLMTEIAKDPPDGKIYIVVFAGGVATCGMLGAADEGAPAQPMTLPEVDDETAEEPNPNG